mmetsp:Transcript_6177/g.15663  ORF Transcript_6177/g.15663 Transcript_6177/m.15663 type:complete len:822 (+) Transcript_6177:193-2658(+)
MASFFRYKAADKKDVEKKEGEKKEKEEKLEKLKREKEEKKEREACDEEAKEKGKNAMKSLRNAKKERDSAAAKEKKKKPVSRISIFGVSRDRAYAPTKASPNKSLELVKEYMSEPGTPASGERSLACSHGHTPLTSPQGSGRASPRPAGVAPLSSPHRSPSTPVSSVSPRINMERVGGSPPRAVRRSPRPQLPTPNLTPTGSQPAVRRKYGRDQRMSVCVFSTATSLFTAPTLAVRRVHSQPCLNSWNFFGAISDDAAEEVPEGGLTESLQVLSLSFGSPLTTRVNAQPVRQPPYADNPSNFSFSPAVVKTKPTVDNAAVDDRPVIGRKNSIDSHRPAAATPSTLTYTRFFDTLANDDLPDPSFIETALWTFPYIMTPAELWQGLRARFEADIPPSSSGQKKKLVTQYRVLRVLKEWLRLFLKDFKTSPETFQSIVSFLKKNLDDVPSMQHTQIFERFIADIFLVLNQELSNPFETDKETPDYVTAFTYFYGKRRGSEIIDWMMNNLMLKTRGQACALATSLIPYRLQGVRHTLSPEPSPPYTFEDNADHFYVVVQPTEDGFSKAKIVPIIDTTEDFSVLKISPAEMAKQMTLMEATMFNKIHPRELLFRNWKRDDKDLLAPHVTEVITFFNKMSSWVASEIVTCGNPKKRVFVLSRFIHIAEECRKLNNLHSVMEIISALQSPSVNRLKMSWRAIPKKDVALLNDLNVTMDVEHHFSGIRPLLHNMPLPALPYLGLYLQDLNMLEEIPSKVKTGDDTLINFSKMQKVAQVIREVRRFQMKKYERITPMQSLWHFLHSRKTYTEKELHNFSTLCEPTVRES